jgi:hypothetical protein
MVGTTGIEPVTPTMSTQCADRKYSEIPDGCTRTVRVCSCSDHGNLGHFLGAPPLMPDIVERDDGRFQIGLDDESAPGPFETRSFAKSIRLRVSA